MLREPEGNTGSGGAEHHPEILVVVDVALFDVSLLRVVYLISGGQISSRPCSR